MVSFTRIRLLCGSVHTNAASINRTLTKPYEDEGKKNRKRLSPKGKIAQNGGETNLELSETDTQQLSALQLARHPTLGRGQITRAVSAEVDGGLFRDSFGDVDAKGGKSSDDGAWCEGGEGD